MDAAGKRKHRLRRLAQTPPQASGPEPALWVRRGT